MIESGATSAATRRITLFDLEELGLLEHKDRIEQLADDAFHHIEVVNDGRSRHKAFRGTKQAITRVPVSIMRLRAVVRSMLRTPALGSPASPEEVRQKIGELIDARDRQRRAVSSYLMEFVQGTLWQPWDDPRDEGYVTLNIRRGTSGSGFMPQRIRTSDLAKFLRVDEETVLQADRDHTILNIVEAELQRRHHQAALDLALSDAFLEPGHPFVAGEAPRRRHYATITVRSTTPAGPVVQPMYTTESRLARYLKVHTDVVRTVNRHRGAEELLIRAKAISDEHLQDLKRAVGCSEKQARGLAIIMDILLDTSSELSDADLQDYQKALAMPLHYNASTGIVTVGRMCFRGKGGGGIVHEAFSESLGTNTAAGTYRRHGRIARKTFHGATLEQQVSMAKQEAEIGLALNGIPYVITTYRTPEGSPFIDYELCEGGELTDANEMLAATPFPAKLLLGKQIAEGVDGIHKRGYAHNDIKYENILLKGNEPRIIDFTLTQKMPGVAPHLRGTPYYVPPEDWLGERTLSPARDAFGVGVILSVLLLGVMPPWCRLPPDDYNKICDTIIQELPSLPALIDEALQLRPGIPVEVGQAVKILLDVDPQKRSIPQAIELLEQAMGKFLVH